MCFEHTLFNYAAYLELADESIEDKVNFNIGCVAYEDKTKIKAEHHAFLSYIRKDGQKMIYECVPSNRDEKMYYVKYVDFFINNNKEVKLEKLFYSPFVLLNLSY